ncbi:TPA: NAD(P)-dependent alcohol dehydrogenase [Escherichia coli]|uniref:NAD(P)-dependent alcohol dehydrogenase n=1 Tax=Escherichia coli TaxID=562 RepID=UPI001C703E0E|nr:NAD(P)-dependent alcohol dehydrogenase [Escherichia coli]EHX0618405.1 NAD(P)-dependent alcohol dehydrogenase [Escherichia coli]EKV8157632.1 NAD(P)-dependent alcohol dehydrogenase [Escherichia coli]ELQ3950718.1 NAD(P)-dependent alcohol dehydrogenase [Escherichia coli]MBW9838769.1 NAD(P)-dependent alcohol dehydrogenase [Escherichia coli]HAZ3488793.1 NAD(P)-dependent alcohol dehydrogenase [Escherichia coli]
MYVTKAYAATSATSPLAPLSIPRRAPNEHDVRIDILFCGVCHSDIHHVRDEFGSAMPTIYPIVPGHEIVGRVISVGTAVTKHKAGDIVAVGCLVDADPTCPHCKANREQYSPTKVLTYNSPDNYGTAPVTYGGYAESIVVDEHFVLQVPENLDLAGVAPLVCAGITAYSPIRRWGVKAGQKVGIVGLGGLGHMGVKFARALGAHVVLFTTSPSKKEDALRVGAHEVVVSRNPEEMQAHAGTFDFILDTVSAPHDLNVYLNMLHPEGNLTLVGASADKIDVSAYSLIFGGRSLSGSLIGGIAETQEMLDFCGQHNITSDVEVIGIQEINEAYVRLEKGDVKYRFSIDMSTLKNA